MAYDSNIKQLPDPITNAGAPGFLSQELVPVDPGMVHPLNSGGVVAVRYPGGSYWNISVTYPEMDIPQAQIIKSFLFSLQGGFKDFYISLPTHKDPQTGVWSGYDASASLSIGTAANLLKITNWALRANAGSVFITPGDMLKISNSHKIYSVIDITPEGNDLIVELNCDILNPVTVASSTLEMNDIKFKVKVTGNKLPVFKLESNGLYGSITLPMRENIL